MIERSVKVKTILLTDQEFFEKRHCQNITSLCNCAVTEGLGIKKGLPIMQA